MIMRDLKVMLTRVYCQNTGSERTRITHGKGVSHVCRTRYRDQGLVAQEF